MVSYKYDSINLLVSSRVTKKKSGKIYHKFDESIYIKNTSKHQNAGVFCPGEAVALAGDSCHGKAFTTCFTGSHTRPEHDVNMSALRLKWNGPESTAAILPLCGTVAFIPTDGQTTRLWPLLSLSSPASSSTKTTTNTHKRAV